MKKSLIILACLTLAFTGIATMFASFSGVFANRGVATEITMLSIGFLTTVISFAAAPLGIKSSEL